jgi:hypothetical protein
MFEDVPAHKHDVEIAQANAMVTPPPKRPRCMAEVCDMLVACPASTVSNPILQGKQLKKPEKKKKKDVVIIKCELSHPCDT